MFESHKTKKDVWGLKVLEKIILNVRRNSDNNVRLTETPLGSMFGNYLQDLGVNTAQQRVF